MPFTKSRSKSLRQDKKQALRNKMVRSKMRTYVRKALESFAGKDQVVAAGALREATRQLDKAAGKGVIHPNQADRRKSRLTARFKTAFETAAE